MLRTITRTGTQCRQLQVSALYYGGQGDPLYRIDTENNTAAAMMVSADVIAALHKKIYMGIGEAHARLFAGRGLHWGMLAWTLPFCLVYLQLSQAAMSLVQNHDSCVACRQH